MKSWFVVRFEDGEPQAVIGPLKKKKAKRLARYYDDDVEVDRHFAVKVEEPNPDALKLARKAEKAREEEASDYTADPSTGGQMDPKDDPQFPKNRKEEKKAEKLARKREKERAKETADEKFERAM